MDIETPIVGTILVVDDEDGIRELTMDILEMDDHSVLLAACGEDALSIIEGDGVSFDVLLTDLTMPGISGQELARRVREARGDTRVIYMSGLLQEGSTEAGEMGAHDWILEKPFSPDDLCQLIQVVLATPLSV